MEARADLFVSGRALSCVLAIAVVGLFLLPSAGLVSAGKGGGGGSKFDYFSGTVNDLSTLRYMMDAKVTCLDTHQTVYTNYAGGFTLYPSIVNHRDTYTVQASGGLNPGYWRHNWYTRLPTSAINYWLPRNEQRSFYDCVQFPNTQYASIGYPNGWSREITNYGYGYGPYCSSDHVPTTYTSAGLGFSVSGQPFGLASSFVTTGVSSSTSPTQIAYDMEEAWIIGGRTAGPFLAYGLQDYLLPTDQAVTQRLPFGDVWVGRGHSMSGTIIEAGSMTSSDGRLGTIGYHGYCPDNYRAPQIEVKSSSAAPLTWTISVPITDPDSYSGGRGGHWFRVFYEGSYAWDKVSANSIYTTPNGNNRIARGLITCHIWCVDSLYSDAPESYQPSYVIDTNVQAQQVHSTSTDTALLGIITTYTEPSIDKNTGLAQFGYYLVSGAEGSSQVEAWVGLDAHIVARHSTFTVSCDWLLSWYSYQTATSAGGSEFAMTLVVEVYDDSMQGALVASKEIVVYSVPVTGGPPENPMISWTAEETGIYYDVGCSVTGTAGHHYSVVTCVHCHLFTLGGTTGGPIPLVGSATNTFYMDDNRGAIADSIIVQY